MRVLYHSKALWLFTGLIWTLLSLLQGTTGQAQERSPPYSEASGGTGGIGVDTPAGHWNAATADLPQVTSGPQGFSIKTSSGRTLQVPSDNPARDRFLTLWWALHNPEHHYFSRQNIPYHAAETLVVEAPDYGHETTSETFSYWAWLEAAYARYTGDFAPLRYVMDRVETYAIPPMQHGTSVYSASSPAQFAPEQDQPKNYPVDLMPWVSTGQDPIAGELRAAYGDGIYGMHWLLDTDNWYGFGSAGTPTYINTFERGREESVWRAVAHPSVDQLTYGRSGSGFLSLFTKDPVGYKRQWRYTAAPDADARIVQAIYWARSFAAEQGNAHAIDDLVAKAVKMGDFLRYGMFDKYFKKIGCQSPSCPGAQGRDGAHYLLGWYYAWGGSSPDDQGAWSWRIGSSHAHFGYQNPLAAYVLSSDPNFRSKTPTGTSDWQISLDRQIAFYNWLQSAEGAIAGGATSSWNGRYDAYPANVATFHDMAYVESPVYTSPASNSWFGWQAWSMERVAEYYEVSGDRQVEPLLDRWVSWVLGTVHLGPLGGFQLPSTLAWSGAPSPSATPQQPANRDLHVQVLDYSEDVGVAGALVRTLYRYADGHHKLHGSTAATAGAAKALADQLTDRLWNWYRDDSGVTADEVRRDYNQFYESAQIPADFVGVMPNGAEINRHSTFLSLRPQFTADPDFPKVQAYLRGGPAPVLRLHRFWSEVDAALAFADADHYRSK